MSRVRTLNLTDLAKELDVLRALKSQCDDAPEGEAAWYDEDRHEALEDLEKQFHNTLTEEAGLEATLIDEDDWEVYCQNEAEELGFIRPNTALTQFVDWSGWADEMRNGYSEYEFDGSTYYLRDR